MSGIARIGGSNSTIAGGKALIGGSVCNLAGGKTMIGGSISTISLKQGVYVNFLFASYLGFTITYNGVTYREDLGDYSATTSKKLYVEPGETITVNMPYQMAVYVNGEIQMHQLPNGDWTVLWSSFPIKVGDWEYVSFEPYNDEDVGIFYE